MAREIYGGTAGNGNLLKWNGTDAWTQVAPKYVPETHIFSLAILNGEIYGGTRPNGNLLKWNGTNAWTQVAPKYVSETSIYSLIVYPLKSPRRLYAEMSTGDRIMTI